MKIKLSVRVNNDEFLEIELSKEGAYEAIQWATAKDSEYSLIIEVDEKNENPEIKSMSENISESKEELLLRFEEQLVLIDNNKIASEQIGLDYENNENNDDEECLEPYDPKKIRVDPMELTIFQVNLLINEKEIDLSPDFQRNFVWTDLTRKSRLIESILLRIPLPMFYFARTKDGEYQVIDGVQRLTVINSYMNNEFKLKNLEYLSDCEGFFYNKKGSDNQKSLPLLYQRRIRDTMLKINTVDTGMPERVKYDIFTRLNTGGKVLNKQEMRNCLASPQTRDLIKKLSKGSSFLKATRNSVKPTRMDDDEIVLRFIAFYLSDNNIRDIHYRGGMDSFLDETVDFINNNRDLIDTEKIIKDFEKSMDLAYKVFGSRAFRKTDYINKSLFLALSRQLYRYDCDERLDDPNFSLHAIEKMENEIDKNASFNESLSMGTNDVKRIEIAYTESKRILKELLL